jgi:hypothetical protein
MTKERLDAWRQEFWETRTNGNPEVWMMLKNCIEEDADTADLLIKTAEMTMP